MPTWNPQQEKAIYTMDKNILVSASAGSGKTTVLIARLLHLVKDKRIGIDQILAMTFTEAAANEMKKRLAKELQDALAQANDAEEKNYLSKQLANMSKASISTIHGFCLDIIKNYYYVLDLEKEACENIMDSTSERMLLNKSMQATFDHFIKHPDFLTLCEMFSTKADANTALEEAITSLFYLANANSNPAAFLESCRKESNLTCMHDYEEMIQTYFYDYLQVQVDSILSALAQALPYYDKQEDIDNILEKQAQLEKAQTYLDAREYTKFHEVFFQQSTLSIKKQKDSNEIEILKKEIESLEAKLHSQLFEETTFVEHSNENAKYINLLVALVRYFMAHYTREKRMRKWIDFSDMEHFALSILQANDGYVANLYRHQFYEIMVDEFQDSNDVQDTLVQLICKQNNVFRVGDIKQSIYGFRHATPDIMRNKINNKGEHDEVIYLSNNYRSKKSIVDFNNTLFDRLMNINGFSCAFSENDCTQTGLDAQALENVAAEMHLLQDKKINEGRFEPFSKDELKASYIANQIIEMRKNKGYRYKDFVVLVKTNAKSECLRDAFETCNIPYFINMKHGFYESSAIMNVISFLRALENPHDDIAMCALLLSPFFQFKDEDLAQAKQHKQKEDSYYTYFKNQDKLNGFEQLVYALQEAKLSEIIARLFYFNHYYEKYTSKQEKTNLDMLYEMIVNKESKQAISLSAFLATLDASNNTQIGEAIPISNNDDVVRVMSIHQSKGLQFPVVFLYSIDSLNLFDTVGLVGFDATLKIALNYIHLKHRLIYPSVERIALNHKATKSALEEEMRVLYVATTRAQKEMIIVDCKEESTIQPLSKVEIYKKNSFTSWILQAYSTSIKDLFFIKYIDQLWEEQVHTTQKETTTELARYPFPVSHKESIAPSDSELFTFTPTTFNIKEDEAMQRGTNLHKMVECLSSQNWDKAHLEDIAKHHQIQLDEHDIQVLLSLQQNDIFKQAQKGKVYHEMPFVVNHEDGIIHGYMDYVSLLDEQIILIDFKSDRYSDEKTLLSHYRKQLETYEKALHILYPNKVIHTYLYSFELQAMIKV